MAVCVCSSLRMYRLLAVTQQLQPLVIGTNRRVRRKYLEEGMEACSYSICVV